MTKDKVLDVVRGAGTRLGGFRGDEHKKKRRIALAGIILLAIVAFLALKGHSKSDDTEVASVQRANVTDLVTLSGRTESASAVQLGFADQGRIAQVLVKEGDRVRSGQLLAKLDTSDLDASLKSARASLTIARADLSTNTTNLDKVTAQQDALVRSAYTKLLSEGLEAYPGNQVGGPESPLVSGSYDGPEGSYVIHVFPSSASSGMSFEISGLENGFPTEIIPGSPVPLGSRGLYVQFGSGLGYINTTWTVSIPNPRSSVYAADMSAYLSVQATRDQVIAAARASLANTEGGDSASEARVAQAQASVDGIVSQIGRREIVAPFDGVVATIDLKPGQSTTGSLQSSGTSDGNTVRLISEGDYEVVLKVPEISIAKVSLGQDVSVRLDAYGDDVIFPGKVTSISPAETIVDGVPVYETKVAFVNPDPRIRSGMTATATIVAARHEQVLAIPASFVHRDRDGSYAYVLTEDGKTERRPVVTGLRGSDSMVEVTSGLSEGERVHLDEVK